MDLENMDYTPATNAFLAAKTQCVCRAIFARRDKRHFSGASVGPHARRRLLTAARHAPGVGFMQRWRFLRATDGELRQRLKALVEKERILTARDSGEREDALMRLEVHGVGEAAELWIVALAEGRGAPVFGRRTMPQMDLAFAACAMQNLCLAARSEEIGVGWLFMFDPSAVAALLHMPEGATPIALLCMGPVHAFYEEPGLQHERWARRRPLDELLFENLCRQARMAPAALESLP